MPFFSRAQQGLIQKINGRHTRTPLSRMARPTNLVRNNGVSGTTDQVLVQESFELIGIHTEQRGVQIIEIRDSGLRVRVLSQNTQKPIKHTNTFPSHTTNASTIRPHTIDTRNVTAPVLNNRLRSIKTLPAGL